MPDGPQPLIEQVTRGDDALGSLFKVSRLARGDRYKILCDVPRGFEVALFTVNAKGEVNRVKGFAIKRSDGFSRLIHPPPGQPPLTQGGPPGTELLLVCASRSPLPAADIEALLTKGGPWPAIKGAVYLSLCPEKVTSPEKGRPGFEGRGGTPFSRTWERLEELREKLRDRCDFFVGVVYGYDG